MGKIIKLLVFTAGVATSALSMFTMPGKAKDYLPVLVEGREWVYGDSIVSGKPVKPINEWTQRTLGRDTVIDDKVWVQIADRFCSTMPETREKGSVGFYFHEDNDVIYGFVGDENTLLFDTCCEHMNMGLEVGDIFVAATVVKVDSIKVRGVVRKRITLKGGLKEEPYTYFVEGIGISNTAYGDYMPGRRIRYLFRVRDKDDNVIFTKDDFLAPSYTGTDGIELIECDAPVDDRIYDLYGNPVANPLPGTIYIRRGHKFVQPH